MGTYATDALAVDLVDEEIHQVDWPAWVTFVVEAAATGATDTVVFEGGETDDLSDARPLGAIEFEGGTGARSQSVTLFVDSKYVRATQQDDAETPPVITAIRMETEHYGRVSPQHDVPHTGTDVA